MAVLAISRTLLLSTGYFGVVETVLRQACEPAQVSFSPDDRIGTYRYLCTRAARKFWRAGLERCDLEQVAAIGLIKAARRYNPQTRTPFEAYAWMMILGELMHHVRDHERTIRIPRRLRVLERRYLATHEALVGRLRREPSDVELASELGVLPNAIVELRHARESNALSSLADAEALPERHASEIDFADRLLVESSFRSLGQTERRIIVGMYILGLTQLEISRRLGISAKSVSRAHHAALGRMQAAWAS